MALRPWRGPIIAPAIPAPSTACVIESIISARVKPRRPGAQLQAYLLPGAEHALTGWAGRAKMDRFFPSEFHHGRFPCRRPVQVRSPAQFSRDAGALAGPL